MNYYAFHIGDYISATQHLSWDEDAAYRRLLDVYYRAEEPLPLDRRALLRLVRATTKAQREAVEAVLGEFFTRTDAGWVNLRADSEVKAVCTLRKAQQDKANKRWGKGRVPAQAQQQQAEAEAAAGANVPDAAASPADATAMPPIPRPIPRPTPRPFPTPEEAPHPGVQGGAAPPAPEPVARHGTPTGPRRDKPLRKPTRREREAAAITAMQLPAWMPLAAWDDFTVMRLGKGRTAPCTPAAMQAIVEELGALRTAGHDPAAVLRRSVVNGWPGVFAPHVPRRSRGSNAAVSPADDWTTRAR